MLPVEGVTVQEPALDHLTDNHVHKVLGHILEPGDNSLPEGLPVRSTDAIPADGQQDDGDKCITLWAKLPDDRPHERGRVEVGTQVDTLLSFQRFNHDNKF